MHPDALGRARTLDQLLTRLGRETGADKIEVCVSDNASADDTRTVIEAHRATFGDRLRYLRHDRNHGMAHDVLAAVELASADYCWLMGSDDAPAGGALERVLSLLANHDGATGFVLGFVRVDGQDLDLPGSVVAPEPFPPQRTVTRFTDLRTLTESLGYMMYFTSTHIVHRERWRAIVASERRQVMRARSAPHLYVTGRMAARDPDFRIAGADSRAGCA